MNWKSIFSVAKSAIQTYLLGKKVKDAGATRLPS